MENWKYIGGRVGPVVCLKVFMNHFQHPFWEIIFIDYTKELQIMAQSLVHPHTQPVQYLCIIYEFRSVGCKF